MKKILFVNTKFEGGGASMVAKGLFSHFNTQSFETYFAYGRGSESSDEKTFKFGNIIEAFVHLFLVRFFGIEGFGCYFSTRKLINYIKKEKFDIVHLHNLHGYYLNIYYFIDFLNKSNIKVVWTLHDEWVLTWLPAHSMSCSHCQTGEGKCVNSYTYPKTYNRFFLKFLLRKKQKAFESLKNLVIICPAQWLADKVRNSYLNGKNVRVIGNGVDINLFKPAVDKSKLRMKYNLSVDEKIVLFSANNFNDINKGTNYILEVAELLIDQRCLFLGLGTGKIIEKKNVKTFGYIGEQEKMAEILSIWDLYCFTSKVETNPLSVLESLSCGLPVIAFDILALREIINENTGEVVPFGDSEQLAKKISLNLNSEERLKEMSKSARDFIVEKFSEEKLFGDYMDVYRDIKV